MWMIDAVLLLTCFCMEMHWTFCSLRDRVPPSCTPDPPSIHLSHQLKVILCCWQDVKIQVLTNLFTFICLSVHHVVLYCLIKKRKKKSILCYCLHVMIYSFCVLWSIYLHGYVSSSERTNNNTDQLNPLTAECKCCVCQLDTCVIIAILGFQIQWPKSYSVHWCCPHQC